MIHGAVFLDELVRAITFHGDIERVFVDRSSGELLYLSDDEIDDSGARHRGDSLPQMLSDDIMKVHEIVSNDNFITIPRIHDINEYELARRFCKRHLCDVLEQISSSPWITQEDIRSFLEHLRRRHLEREWYRFRQQAIRDYAITWCQQNMVSFRTDNYSL